MQIYYQQVKKDSLIPFTSFFLYSFSEFRQKTLTPMVRQQTHIQNTPISKPKLKLFCHVFFFSITAELTPASFQVLRWQKKKKWSFSPSFSPGAALRLWWTVALGQIFHQVLRFSSSTPHHWGKQWRSWLRHCATSRKVAGSIPDGVIGIFRWHNPSGRTMALGLTQPLTEISTRNVSWG